VKPAIKKILIAYSGGLDSHALLHLLVQLRKTQPKLQLVAIHINHNLSLNAKLWTKHCKKICKNLRVRCIIKSVKAKVKFKDYSPEEIARKLRYEAFAENLPKNAVLVTAHHADDQAETLLLQLFRGAGPKGLAAMPTKAKFGKGWLVRPLLCFSREELLQYAKEYKLRWIEDESNADIKFQRNLIRHKLMPIIRKTWPGITTTLNRAATLCAAANELLEDLAAEDLVNAVSDKGALAIGALKKLSLARQKNVLRFWLNTLHLPIPSEAKLNEIIRTVINSRSDAKPLVCWQGIEIRRFQNYLYAMAQLLLHDKKQILQFNLRRPLKLPGNLGVLHAKTSKKFLATFKSKKFTVQFRRGGEKLKLSKRQGTRELKKLMQEWQIPPWLRDRTPLVYCGNEIIAVVGYYCIDGMQFYNHTTLKENL
jgi:tRNA(Ile)-lysidine synthase